MPAILKAENINLEKDIVVKLISIDNIAKTALVESNNIKITMQFTDPDNELEAMVGKKITVAFDGTVKSASGSAKTTQAPKIRTSGAMPGADKNPWNL